VNRERLLRTSRQKIEDLLTIHGDSHGLDLSQRDMSGEDLSGLTLRGAVLERCNLRRAKLEGTDLSHADLFKADLGLASLSNVNLEGASLGEVNLEGSWMVRANLKGARLLSGRLSGAALTEADLEGATLWGVDLRGAHLHWARLRGADLRGAELQGADLGGADMRETILWDSNLREAVLRNADMRGARLQNADLGRAHLEFAALESADLSQIKSLEGAFLHGTRWGGNFLSPAKLGSGIGEEEEGEYRRAAVAYLALHRLFRESTSPSAASWAYVRARQMARKAASPRHAHPRLGRHTFRWLMDWLAEVSCGYGEKPGRVLAWALATLLLFPLLYRASGGLLSGAHSALTWPELVTYSLATFATLKLDGYRALTLPAQLLTSLQGLLGLGLLGLALYAFGRQAGGGWG
jgi:uncharacterized protein YjbI with pentapeptide repeats